MKRSIAIDLPDGETGDLQRRTCDLSILTDDQDVAYLSYGTVAHSLLDIVSLSRETGVS
jgi:hypothetical protein